jgi:hypothetical protein
MATVRQIEANRRNALKSTGPRTSEGKERSRWNSLKHGLCAGHIVLPYEHEADYHEIRASLIECHRPGNAQELMLVDQIAQSYFRILRARAVETGMLDLQIEDTKRRHGISSAPRPDDHKALAVSFATESSDGMVKYLRYDGSIERAYYRALAHLRKVQNDRLRRERQAQAEDPSPPVNDTIAEVSPEPPQPRIGFVSQKPQRPALCVAQQSPEPPRQPQASDVGPANTYNEIPSTHSRSGPGR